MQSTSISPGLDIPGVRLPVPLGPDLERAMERLADFGVGPAPWTDGTVAGADRSQPGAHQCIFSWGPLPDGQVYRTVAIARTDGQLPEIIEIATIAHHFGFTGAKAFGDVALRPGPDWAITKVERGPSYVVVVQPLPDPGAQ